MSFLRQVSILLLSIGLVGVLAEPSIALETSENNPILTKAAQMLRNGQGDEALSIYEAYLKQNPQSLEARIKAGLIAERFYDFGEARKHLERAVADHPESARAAAELGRMFHRWSQSPLENQRDYTARAEEYLQMARNIDPEDPEALTYMGMWQLDNGDTISAERNFQKVVRTHPKFIPAYHGLVQFYIQVNDLRRAKETALQAIERDERNHLSHFYTARLLAFADYPADALKYARQSERLDFGQMPERDRFIAEQLEKLGQLNEAATYYERIAKLLPNDAKTYQRLASIYGSTGKEQQSTQLMQKAASMDSRILDQMIRDARTSIRTGQTQQAITQWRKIMAIDAENTEAYSTLASLYFGQVLNGRLLSRDALMEDVSLYDQKINTNSDIAQLDRVKLQAAIEGNVLGVKPKLSMLAKVNQDSVAGEAAFLAGDLKTARERLEFVDGLSAAEYAHWGDRLFLDNELHYSKVFYQRAYEMDANVGVQPVLAKINARIRESERKIDEGNTLYSAKQYQEALLRYEEAARLYVQSDSAWLRLADTYEKVKDREAAFDAYDRAVQLNPALLDSEGFSKKYNKLEKKYAPEVMSK